MVEKTQDNTSFVVNETKNPDSIEYRTETGKNIKVYGDGSNPEEFKKKAKDMLKILKDLDNE